MIVIPFVLVAWVVFGFVRSGSATSTAPAPAAPCADCVALRTWYAGLDWWQQILDGPGYFARQWVCVARGC